ncbi:MAG: sulfate permease [Sphingomonadaceae bacterium]|nr:sulfate permease [Sphingomonadaceae bacterium]
MRDVLPIQFTPKLVTALREGYDMARLRADALAGLTVAIVALPLAMALGIASGASPDKGLVTAVVAGFLISALGGSRTQIGGPTGAFVVVVFNIIAQHGYDGLVLATLMAGLILLVAGYARLGSLIKFIPHPVVTGFTAGIAVIIAASQIKDFLGLRMAEVPADFLPKIAAYWQAIGTTHLATLGVGAAALGIIIVLRRTAPKVPGFLVAVVVSALAVSLLGLPVDTVGSRFPDIPSGLPAPHVPALGLEKMTAVLPAAFTIAFLAGIEALLSAVVADGMTGYRHRSNQELVGQGAANLVSALFGGLPATGAIARTATNIRAGGRTPLAGMFHALFLLLFMAFGTDLMGYIPMAALAAILFMVAWGMSEYERLLRIRAMPVGDRVVLLLTFALTVLVDLTVAIGVGVTLASLMFMERMSRTVAIKVHQETETEEAGQRDALPPGVEVFRITGPFFFGVAADLVETLRRMGQPPRIVILRMREVPLLDASGVEGIKDFVSMAHRNGAEVIFSNVQPLPAQVLRRNGLGPRSGKVRFAPDYAAALAMAALPEA